MWAVPGKWMSSVYSTVAGDEAVVFEPANRLACTEFHVRAPRTGSSESANLAAALR